MTAEWPEATQEGVPAETPKGRSDRLEREFQQWAVGKDIPSLPSAEKEAGMKPLTESMEIYRTFAKDASRPVLEVAMEMNATATPICVDAIETLWDEVDGDATKLTKENIRGALEKAVAKNI